MRIDAHQHFWKLSRGDYDWLTPALAPIYRDFQPADMQPILQDAGMDATVLVQAAASEAETDYMLSLADDHDWIIGVVGWVELSDPGAVAAIRRFAEHPKFMGLRPMIQDIADPDWMLRPDLAPAIAVLIELGLSFDALTLPRHLQNLAIFLARYPDLKVVIDHGSKPEIRHGTFEPWAAQMAKIAAEFEVCCKLSGLVTEAGEGWSDVNILPYARHIIESFGPDRVMFGSDWPVLTLASDYPTWLSLAEAACAGLSERQKALVFGGTAQRFYQR